MTDTNVFAWLEHAAATDPHKPAFADEQYELSYGDLLTQAQAVASALTRVGASRAPVAILLPPGVAQVVSLFGVMAAGSYYPCLTQPPPLIVLNAL
jgi:acyl-CoA synthetase (AMP-forming)/AMP-acid ligase II